MRKLLLLGFVLVIAFAALGSAATETARAGAAKRIFFAFLNGRQEVPSVAAPGKGLAIFQLNAAGTRLRYKMVVANVPHVVASHIHLAPRGENGDVVAFLFGGPETKGCCLVVSGVITGGDLIGELEGQPLSALIDELRDGNAYANVHTSAHPSGEVRGQIR